MRRSCGLVVLIGLGMAWAGVPVRGEDPAALEKLVAKMGSRRFAEREAATSALLARPGAATVRLLLKASVSSDAEVRRRALLVLDHLGRRREAEQVLQPQRIRLSYKDVTVADAVADFTRRTGLAIVLDKAELVKLAGRKITLETAETTTWDAFRQLCDKAGLIENTPVAKAAQPSPNRYMELGGLQAVQARQVIFLDGRHSPPPKPDDRLILVVGKGARPTCLAGALRIQVAGQRAVKSAAKASTNLAREVTLTLNVHTEPRLGWNRVVALRVDTAVDSLGQKLRQPAVYVGDGGAGGLFQANEVIVLWDGLSELPTNKSRQVPVRLLLGERSARKIKELRGVLSAEVEAPSAPLVTVTDVLKAVGKPVQGPDGTYVKVLEAKREPGGKIALKVEVKGPAKKSDFGGLGNVRIMRINRRRLIAPPERLSAMSSVDAFLRGLALQDGKGNSLDLASGNYQVTDDPRSAQVYTLHYQPRKGQEGPFRFVFSGRRTVVIDVPFTLKDIPLP